ncbi:MAG: 3-deoxy-manno-octulosonate cytidylyltransferase [Thermodesulfobacteriota bacterium]
MSRIIAIIPARMASTRFPGKPLADILGLPMIEHVRRRVALAPLVNEVVVATCDREIAEAVVAGGGRAVMTAPTHERCTDRVAEAALGQEADIVINVQGDEPLVHPAMLEPLLSPLLAEATLPCTNLMAKIHSEAEFHSPNVVKTVCDLKGNALYFSREPIPSLSKAGGLVFAKYKQLGIIAFRREFLQCFTNLPPTPLEQVESVDMLRAVEHGYPVRMVETSFDVVGVDTPEDLARAKQLMETDPLFPSYR